MIDYAEKRNFQRMTLDCTMEYSFPGDNEMHCATVKNLSATGIMFITEQSIAAGSELNIRLTPENTITPPMDATVVVIRCDAQQDGDFLLAGEISDIS